MLQPVFDGHNDALIRCSAAELAAGRPDGHLDLPRMVAGGMRGGIFAIFTPPVTEHQVAVPRDDGVLEFALPEEASHERAAAWVTQIAGRLFALERDGSIRVARTGADLDAAHGGDGPPVAVLHFEGAEAIDLSFESLDFWYAAGLRSLGLVWSRPNRFGHGVPFIFPSPPDTGPGLTEPGLELVRRCAAMGIMVDLAHLNEKGFWDVASLDAGPLVSSHTAAWSLSACSRNLTDKQLDAVASSGGLVGVVYACAFLRADFAESEDTPLALIAEHARYIADRIGVQHVALGSDFDGTTIPAELGGADGLPGLIGALRDVGFTSAEVDAIAWGNWRRVLGAWWGSP